MRTKLFKQRTGTVQFALSMFVSARILAQSVTTGMINLDEMAVAGTKAGMNQNDVPLTVSVVLNEKRENSSESDLLPVLAEQVPGLFITECGNTGFDVSTGSAGQVSLRGIGGNPNTQVLILLNGNPQFLGIMGQE